MMGDLPGYAPSEEHELLRQTVRDLADAKIAPAAADVDATSRFPQEARGARGISAFVVEKTDQGVAFGSPEKKLGIKGSPTRTVIFENTRIPADRMIGAEGAGFKTALATLDHTRITIAAQALGIAQGALDYAVGYVRQREQFGQPVAQFQGVQFMLADLAMQIEAARQLTYHAAVLSEHAMNGKKVSGLTFASSAAKCLASDTAMQVTTDAVQLLGG
jgi:alkylation response protein AidB-like acyl-CoA dehydrogenase